MRKILAAAWALIPIAAAAASDSGAPIEIIGLIGLAWAVSAVCVLEYFHRKELTRAQHELNRRMRERRKAQ